MTAATARRLAIVLNAGSGDGLAESARDQLAPLLRAAGIDAVITLVRDGEALRAAIDAAIADRVDTVVAGGGDGTVNAVADAILGREIQLGVLPMGTLNHFARDLGIPVEFDAAAAVIVAGITTRVDVGQVSGRVFLNNSSVGLYPRIVQLRERYRARGAEKWLVATWATWRVTRSMRHLRLRIVVDGQEEVFGTPLVFVGNNEYRMAGFDAGSRESLTTGRLAVYVVRAEGRWQLLRLVWRILMGTAQETGALAMTLAEGATVELMGSAAWRPVAVAVDGEVATLALPLAYVIHPQALSVLVPG